MNPGISYALLAYITWGFLPIFWKQIKEIAALEILFHRFFWSFLFYTVLLFFVRGKAFSFKRLKRRDAGTLFLAAIILTSNWLLYIWAVNAGFIVETSLGYFISPLSMIVLGILFLGERLKRHQLIAVTLASLGVVVVGFEAGRLPWIALALAFSFSFYGFLRKRLDVQSLEGGQWETLFLLPLCIGYFVFNREDLLAYSPRQWLYLVASGAATGLPLLWFTEAAQKLPYYMMGFFQFIAPTLMFLTGVLIYDESMSPFKLAGFIFIWAAMAVLLLGPKIGARNKA